MTPIKHPTTGLTPHFDSSNLDQIYAFLNLSPFTQPNPKSYNRFFLTPSYWNTPQFPRCSFFLATGNKCNLFNYKGVPDDLGLKGIDRSPDKHLRRNPVWPFKNLPVYHIASFLHVLRKKDVMTREKEVWKRGMWMNLWEWIQSRSHVNVHKRALTTKREKKRTLGVQNDKLKEWLPVGWERGTMKNGG